MMPYVVDSHTQAVSSGNCTRKGGGLDLILIAHTIISLISVDEFNPMFLFLWMWQKKMYFLPLTLANMAHAPISISCVVK